MHPNSPEIWIFIALASVVIFAIGSVGVMCLYQNERVIIDRTEGIVRIWKADRIPFKSSSHALHEIASCIVTAQERRDEDYNTYTAYAVRLIFKNGEATVLETQNKSEAVSFATELSVELGIQGDPRLIQQLSEQDQLRRWVGLDDSNSDSKS